MTAEELSEIYDKVVIKTLVDMTDELQQNQVSDLGRDKKAADFLLSDVEGYGVDPNATINLDGNLH